MFGAAKYAPPKTFSFITGPSKKDWIWSCLRVSADEILAADLAKISAFGTMPGTRIERNQDIELKPGEVLLTAERPRRKGHWRHDARVVVDGFAGPTIVLLLPSMARKLYIKEHAPHLMDGSGPNAAIVRMARFVLEGADTIERRDRAAKLAAI